MPAQSRRRRWFARRSGLEHRCLAVRIDEFVDELLCERLGAAQRIDGSSFPRLQRDHQRPSSF